MDQKKVSVMTRRSKEIGSRRPRKEVYNRENVLNAESAGFRPEAEAQSVLSDRRMSQSPSANSNPDSSVDTPVKWAR
jgi:hypothetical protein